MLCFRDFDLFVSSDIVSSFPCTCRFCVLVLFEQYEINRGNNLFIAQKAYNMFIKQTDIHDSYITRLIQNPSYILETHILYMIQCSKLSILISGPMVLDEIVLQLVMLLFILKLVQPLDKAASNPIRSYG
jgi:hypothetical protein